MKSARTKACDISPEIRRIVEERDAGGCVICNRRGHPNMHYIPRSAGGLGIAQNIVCGCLKCHDAYDNGNMREEYGKIIREYLKSQYADWDESKLYYKKYPWSAI